MNLAIFIILLAVLFYALGFLDCKRRLMEILELSFIATQDKNGECDKCLCRTVSELLYRWRLKK